MCNEKWLIFSANRVYDLLGYFLKFKLNIGSLIKQHLLNNTNIQNFISKCGKLRSDNSFSSSREIIWLIIEEMVEVKLKYEPSVKKCDLFSVSIIL